MKKNNNLKKKYVFWINIKTKIQNLGKKLGKIKFFENIQLKNMIIEKHKKSIMLKIRFIIVLLFTIFSYFFVIKFLYFHDRVLFSLIFVFIFFISFHFLFLEIRYFRTRFFICISIFLTIIELIFLGFDNLRVLSSVATINSTIFILAIYLKSASSGRRKFDIFLYSSSVRYIFTMMIVLSYSLFLLGGSGFKITCDGLQKSSNEFIEFLSNPLKHGINEVNNDVKKTQDKIADIFNTKLKDILPTNNIITINKGGQENNIFTPIAYKFHELQIGISNMMKDNTVVNEGVCELMMNEIKERYNKPSFQFSVLILMFFVLYPFVRLSFFVVSFLIFLIFKLLYFLKIYKIKKIEELVDEII